MAEEFTLSVGVDADMTKFRQTLRQELEAAARQQATVPVGATAGAAGTTTVPPGGAGVSPGASLTANTVAQQSAQAVSNAVARAGLPFNGTISGMSPAAMATQNAAMSGGFDPNGWQALNPGGWAAVNAAAAAGGGVPAGTPGVPPGMPQQMPPLPIPGRGFGGSGMRSGMGRFATGYYFAHAASGLLTAEMDYGRASRMAETPEEEIKAEIQHRHAVAGAFPIAGPIGLAIREAVTGEEEGIDRTLRDARNRDAYTGSMQQVSALAERFRSAGDIAGARGSKQRRLVADFEYQSSTFMVRDAQAKAATESHARFEAQRRTEKNKYDTAMAGLVRMQGSLGTAPGPYAAPDTSAARARIQGDYDAQLQSIQTAENDAVGKLKDKFGPMLSSAEAVKRSAYEDISDQVTAANLRNLGAARGSFLRMTGRPFEASVSERFTNLGAELLLADDNKASIALRGAAGIGEDFANLFRETSHNQRQLTWQGRILQAQVDRDPLAAKILGIRADTEENVYGFDKVPAPFRGMLQGATRFIGGLRERLANQEDSDARQLRIQSLDNRKEHYDLLAENRPYSARATDIRHETEEDVAAMRQSKRFTADEIKKRIEEGISEEKSFESQLRRRMAAGFGTEVAAGSYAPGISGSDTQEPVVRAVGTVKDAIDKLTALLTGN